MARSDNVSPLHGTSDISAEERVRLFDNAFEAAIFGLTLIDPAGRIAKANGRFAEMIGRPADDLIGTSFVDLTHPSDVATNLLLFNKVLAGISDGYRLDKRYLRADGTIVDALLTVTAMRRPTGELMRVLSQIEDVTELRRTERALAERATQLELAMEAVRGGFWHMDVSTNHFQTSDRLARFIGGPRAAMMDLDAYLDHVHSDDREATNLTPLLDGIVDRSVAEYRLQTIDGERWMRCDRRLLRHSSGDPFRVIGVVIDFTEEHLRRQALESDADTDTLTKLYNRRGLEKKFKQLNREGGTLLLAIDLDGFKEINDVFGHAAGDQVLVEAAERLRSVVRPHDAVCRLGGDEFAVIMTGDGSIAQTIADRIVVELSVPIDLEQGSVLAQGSVGGAWTHSPFASLQDLMRCADRCLYDAKDRGKRTAVVCELD